MRFPHLPKLRTLFASRTKDRPRRGAIIVLSAFLMIAMLGMLALSIDTGYMYTMQTQLDRSVDSAALAGAGSLIDGLDIANDKVLEYLVRNPVGQPNSIVAEDELSALIAQFLADHQDDYQIVAGNWDPQSGTLIPTNQMPSAISVTVQYPNLPLFFAKALGKSTFDLQSQAVAMYQPRDIMVVLDFSGSMNDDSELKSISKFGQATIINGLAAMHAELGSPSYGSLPVMADYITVHGTLASDSTQADIDVEYRYKSVYVTSTKSLSSVKLKYSNGNTQTFSGLSGTTGTFAGTSGNSGKPIYHVWVTSGSTSNEYFDFNSSTIRSTIKTALGLDSVPYPYPSGSWNSFIDYGRSNSTNRNAGLEYKFGFVNLMNYWLEQKPMVSQTPDLWKCSAQPVTAVKDAVDVFLDYVRLVDTNDRMGLVVYDAVNGEGELETGLTTNMQLVSDLTRQRQAGHYHRYTNIGAGIRTARQELQANGRTGAFKMIVLMTDGRANWYNGGYNTSAARNDVIAEANAAAALNYPVVAISLGAGADISLMDQVATITESKHFNIPGGQAVADYRDALFQVFRSIADARPLKLVH